MSHHNTGRRHTVTNDEIIDVITHVYPLASSSEPGFRKSLRLHVKFNQPSTYSVTVEGVTYGELSRAEAIEIYNNNGPGD